MNKKFQEGDIETLRASKAGNLTNIVIENVQEKYPEFSEQEAFDYAMNLPTQAEEKVKLAEVNELKEKEKTLSKYLEVLKKKQKELAIKADNELTAQWNEVVSRQEQLTKIIEVSKEQLPIGEGKEKVSRLEARVKQTLDNLTPGQIEQLGLSKYKQLNNKENIKRASEFVSQDPDRALRVLMGDENPPEGILVESIFVVMANNSTDNMELAIKLASLRATRYGQEIQILKELIPDSNVKLLSDIAKMKEQGVAERFNIKGIDEVIRKRTRAVVKRVKQTFRKKLARTNWDAFINSIETC